MFAHAAPVKTPLGHEELRRRSLSIGQRHRTVLFLVDGRRPLSEVLSLSHQAGALTSHFEELVRLGLVELPSETLAADPVETAPSPLDLPFVTSVELEVPAEEDAPWIDPPMVSPTAQAESAPLLSVEVMASVQPLMAPTPAPPPAPLLADPPAVKAETVPAANPGAAQPALVLAELARRADAAAQKPAAWVPVEAPAAPTAPIAPVRVASAPVTKVRAAAGAAAKPKPRPSASRRLPARQTLVARPHSPHAPLDPTDERLLQQVRDLLIDTLRIDAPLFGARMLIRARAAKAPNELIDLVWKIEKHLSRSRHSRNALISLQRARELLGLGNTVVAGDTAPERHEG